MDPNTSPPPNPEWIQRLTMVLIGAPGMILWIGGALYITSLVALPGWFEGPIRDPIPYLISWAAPTAGIWIGRAMLAYQRYFRGFQDYRMPDHRLLAYVSLEALELWMAAVAIGLLFGMVGAVDRSAMPAAFGWLSATIAGIALHRWLRKRRMLLGVRWQIELSRLKGRILQTSDPD